MLSKNTLPAELYPLPQIYIELSSPGERKPHWLQHSNIGEELGTACLYAHFTPWLHDQPASHPCPMTNPLHTNPLHTPVP